MISASKSNLSLKNLNILRPKVTKNLKNFCKKFCEYLPRHVRKSISEAGVVIAIIGKAVLFFVYSSIEKEKEEDKIHCK